MQVAAGRLLNSHQQEAVTLLQVSSCSCGENHLHDDHDDDDDDEDDDIRTTV